MASDNSVTHWVGALQAGDDEAARQLWDRYYRRLVGLARQKLADAPRRAADEEDVAISAFASFCRGVEAGRFEQLDDRDNLWSLLVVITARKAFQWMRRETRQKRGGGAVVGESAVTGPDDSTADDPPLHQILSAEPTPEFAAELADECRRLFDQLADPELEQIALWKMEGYSHEEIAERLNCVPRTVERRLRLIRTIWSQELPA